jgi:hypothetical protein
MAALRRGWFVPLLFLIGVVAFGVALTSSWLPLLFSLPWLVAIAWLSRGGSLDDREPQSLADAASRRLWTR